MTKHRSNDIQVLSDVEHVRKRPQMYVGATDLQVQERWCLNKDATSIEHREIEYVPGILKLFDEIISNSIDEALRTNFQFANKIKIDIDGNAISIEDNGRGISSKINKEFGKSEAELALTHLRAGSNFGDDKFVSIGTHGLGASLVNILSSRFHAETSDGKKNTVIRCRVLPDNKSISCSVSSTRSSTKGTKIAFVPDFGLFGIDNLNADILSMMHKRVMDLALCFPQIQFKFNRKVVKTRSLKNYLSMITDHAETFDNGKCQVAVFPVEEPSQISFVNGIDTYEGGTHVNIVKGKVAGALLEKLKKKHKKLNLRANDVNNKICWVVLTNQIQSPKFRSQTKEFISNSPAELNGIFDDVDNDAFINRILRNDEIIDPIIETKKLKVEAQERVQLKRENRKIKKVRVPKHLPANGDPDKTILYITEGDSASGMLQKVRDPNLHGCFPLRGKPLNTWDKKPTTIIKNNELQQLMAVLNLKLGEKATDLNYGKIKILCDADYDGYCIVSLLLAFFYNWKELFEEDRISIVRCPIIVASKKNHQTKRFYSISAYTNGRKTGEIDQTWSLTYLKGLGSLNEAEYERMIHQPVEDLLGLDDDARSALELAFGTSADERKKWLQA